MSLRTQGRAHAPSGGRIEQLDSVRGLAALSVVICHILNVMPAVWNAYLGHETEPTVAWLLLPPTFLFWAGHAAVLLFFTLSGYVLFLPTLQGRQPAYPTYALKRFCRIYIPYAVAVLGTMACAAFFARSGFDELSEWFRSSWTKPVETQNIVEHLLLLPAFPTLDFNNAIWSLVHEMRISLIFPLLAWAVLRWNWKWSLGVAFAVSLAGCAVPKLHPSLKGLEDYGLTLHYASMFTLGALLAKHADAIQTTIRGLRPTTWTALVACGFLLYLFEGLYAPARMGRRMHQYEYVTALGACVLIVCATSAEWLRAKFPVWLGRISYSLYLWHLPVLLTIVHLGYGRAPLWVLLPASIVASLAVAEAMYRFVEEPSIRLAKRVGSKRRAVSTPQSLVAAPAVTA
ncbi:MAG: acyltransferase [Pirellulales bacterium]